jgi:hypothetical protein
VVKALGRLRQLHQHIGAMGGERPHRGPLPCGAVDGGVLIRLCVRVIRDRHRLSGAVDTLLLQRGPAQIACRGGGRRFVAEAQHRVQKHLLVLERPRRRETVDQPVPARHGREFTRPDQRQGLGVGQHDGPESERGRQLGVDLPRAEDVVGHALRLDRNAHLRVTRDAELGTRFGRIRPHVELVDVD